MLVYQRVRAFEPAKNGIFTSKHEGFRAAEIAVEPAENVIWVRSIAIYPAEHVRKPMDYLSKKCVLRNKHVPSKLWVRPHSHNTSKQYDILITRGWMKTLAIRSDVDFMFSEFRVLI